MSTNFLYKKFHLNRSSASKDVIEYLENVLIREDESIHHSFHKVVVHKWAEDDVQLFNALRDHYNLLFVPVDYVSKNEFSSFYTSSLSFILKIIKLDFMFPHRRTMFNVDIILNNKSSVDCFETNDTIEEIVTAIVSKRFSDKMELNLSDFCNDPEFTRTRINFYSLDLLSNFKILMLRMGRDTKILNLSNNQLIQVPLDIMNFFARDMIGLNLSNNNIPSVDEQFRVGSKIEKIWLEGNPLCEDISLNEYIKKILIKFPRLAELDGVKINQHGILYPFVKYYIGQTPQKKTSIVVEKFLRLYFAHYDKTHRNSIDMFYDMDAVLTVSIDFTNFEKLKMPHYTTYAPKPLNPAKRAKPEYCRCVFETRNSIVNALSQFPETTHDMSTFCVDVLLHDSNHMILVIDGIYKENAVRYGNGNSKSVDDASGETPTSTTVNYLRFRRTFVFSINMENSALYKITNESFSIALAEHELTQNSFKCPIKKINNELGLLNPDKTECKTICKVFRNITTLKKTEAERRLQSHNWNISLALKELVRNLKNDEVPNDHLAEEDSCSDESSEVD